MGENYVKGDKKRHALDKNPNPNRNSNSNPNSNLM